MNILLSESGYCNISLHYVFLIISVLCISSFLNYILTLCFINTIYTDKEQNQFLTVYHQQHTWQIKQEKSILPPLMFCDAKPGPLITESIARTEWPMLLINQTEKICLISVTKKKLNSQDPEENIWRSRLLPQLPLPTHGMESYIWSWLSLCRGRQHKGQLKPMHPANRSKCTEQ